MTYKEAASDFGSGFGRGLAIGLDPLGAVAKKVDGNMNTIGGYGIGPSNSNYERVGKLASFCFVNLGQISMAYVPAVMFGVLSLIMNSATTVPIVKSPSPDNAVLDDLLE